MNELLRRSTQPSRRLRWRMRTLGAAGLALALVACVHSNTDDVKPTATTAYHSGEPATQLPSVPASSPPARE